MTAAARVLVAPDSFKGTLSAFEVAEAIARGIETAGVAADRCPLADGGEGTLDVLAPALAAALVRSPAHDPLGRPIEAAWGWAPASKAPAGKPAAQAATGREPPAHDATAIVETAAASGLALVEPGERDASTASTYGTGELIAAAAAAGARTILLAAGGSATTDGGEGALAALAAAGGLRGAQLVVLCDVQTPFERAAQTFAPQKGADPATTARLADRLDALADRLPRDPRGIAMTGCAGGLSGGLWAALGARLVPGAAFMLDALHFDHRLQAAQAVVTGEGRLDAQTAEGKLVAEVARRARTARIPAYALVGQDALTPVQHAALGLAGVVEAGTPQALEAAAAALAERTRGYDTRRRNP